MAAIGICGTTMGTTPSRQHWPASPVACSSCRERACRNSGPCRVLVQRARVRSCRECPCRHRRRRRARLWRPLVPGKRGRPGVADDGSLHPLREHESRRVHRHPQRLRPRSDGDTKRRQDPRRRASRPVRPWPRGEPRSFRGRPWPRLWASCADDARLPRRDGGGCVPSARARACSDVARGPRTVDAEAGVGAHRRSTPVLRPCRAHRIRARAPWRRPFLAPEVAVVIAGDRATAREAAQGYLDTYLALENYTNNLRRFNFGEDDIKGSGSDRLLDALVAWGDAQAIRARVAEHLAGGADHVCIQPLPAGEFQLEQLRELAPALLEL